MSKRFLKMAGVLTASLLPLSLSILPVFAEDQDPKTAIKRPPTVDTTTGDGSESEQPTGGNSIGGGNTSGGLQADTSISIALQSVEDGTRYYPENGTLTAYQLTDSYVVDEDGNYTFHYLDESFDGASASEIEFAIDNGNTSYAASFDEMIGSDGTLKFSGIPYGVYLISQTIDSAGFNRMNPVLVTICDMSNAEYIGDHVIIEPKIELPAVFDTVVPTGIQSNIPIFAAISGIFGLFFSVFAKNHATGS